MHAKEIQPQTKRGRILKKVWGSAPLVLLIATVVLIISLFSVINA